MTEHTKKSAFAEFGTKQTNERWSWSAISDDNSVVAVTVWKDHVKLNDKGKPHYDGFDDSHENTIHLWGDQPGNEDRKKHLKYSVEKLNSLVRVVITVAVDPEKHPREIREVYPYNNLWFKITKFDETTGQFKLEYSHKDD